MKPCNKEWEWASLGPLVSTASALLIRILLHVSLFSWLGCRVWKDDNLEGSLQSFSQAWAQVGRSCFQPESFGSHQAAWTHRIRTRENGLTVCSPLLLVKSHESLLIHTLGSFAMVILIRRFDVVALEPLSYADSISILFSVGGITQLGTG